jgi:hypothetical protein
MLWGVGISRSQWCDDIERIGAIFVIKLVSFEYSTGVTSPGVRFSRADTG